MIQRQKYANIPCDCPELTTRQQNVYYTDQALYTSVKQKYATQFSSGLIDIYDTME